MHYDVIVIGAGAAGCALAARLAEDPQRDEIVLCAGAVSSPHLLLLSGLGPAAQLRAQGITVLRDIPGVGQNLRNHPSVGGARPGCRWLCDGRHGATQSGEFTLHRQRLCSTQRLADHAHLDQSPRRYFA